MVLVLEYNVGGIEYAWLLVLYYHEPRSRLIAPLRTMSRHALALLLLAAAPAGALRLAPCAPPRVRAGRVLACATEQQQQPADTDSAGAQEHRGTAFRPSGPTTAEIGPKYGQIDPFCQIYNN